MKQNKTRIDFRETRVVWEQLNATKLKGMIEDSGENIFPVVGNQTEFNKSQKKDPEQSKKPQDHFDISKAAYLNLMNMAEIKNVTQGQLNDLMAELTIVRKMDLDDALETSEIKKIQNKVDITREEAKRAPPQEEKEEKEEAPTITEKEEKQKKMVEDNVKALMKAGDFDKKIKELITGFGENLPGGLTIDTEAFYEKAILILAPVIQTNVDAFAKKFAKEEWWMPKAMTKWKWVQNLSAGWLFSFDKVIGASPNLKEIIDTLKEHPDKLLSNLLGKLPVTLNDQNIGKYLTAIEKLTGVEFFDGETISPAILEVYGKFNSNDLKVSFDDAKAGLGEIINLLLEDKKLLEKYPNLKNLPAQEIKTFFLKYLPDILKTFDPDGSKGIVKLDDKGVIKTVNSAKLLQLLKSELKKIGDDPEGWQQAKLEKYSDKLELDYPAALGDIGNIVLVFITKNPDAQEIINSIPLPEFVAESGKLTPEQLKYYLPRLLPSLLQALDGKSGGKIFNKDGTKIRPIALTKFLKEEFTATGEDGKILEKPEDENNSTAMDEWQTKKDAWQERKTKEYSEYFLEGGGQKDTQKMAMDALEAWASSPENPNPWISKALVIFLKFIQSIFKNSFSARGIGEMFGADIAKKAVEQWPALAELPFPVEKAITLVLGIESEKTVSMTDAIEDVDTLNTDPDSITLKSNLGIYLGQNWPVEAEKIELAPNTNPETAKNAIKAIYVKKLKLDPLFGKAEPPLEDDAIDRVADWILKREAKKLDPLNESDHKSQDHVIGILPPGEVILETKKEYEDNVKEYEEFRSLLTGVEADKSTLKGMLADTLLGSGTDFESMRYFYRSLKEARKGKKWSEILVGDFSLRDLVDKSSLKFKDLIKIFGHDSMEKFKSWFSDFSKP